MIRETLPAESARQRIVEAVRSRQIVQILGRTGTGKTTQVPQFLLDEGFGAGRPMVCTQPRRVAAIAAATRVAEERGGKIGDEVGYQIRFEGKTSRRTRLKFVTCGVLLREMMRDPLLSSYEHVIVDEVHERDIFTDFLLGYLKHLCRKRPQFKLMLMSATHNWRELQAFFPDAGIVRIPFAMHPVRIEYCPVSSDRLSDAMASDIRRICADDMERGDILAFLPGERDISTLMERVVAVQGAEIYPLYGALSPDQQRRVWRDVKHRKVILATNIAESSLTLPGVTWVLDSGLAKIAGYDACLDAETLDTRPISRASADQRAGRAGRVQPGTCIRYYAENDFLARHQYDDPAICRSDLAGLVLAMKRLGLDRDFDLPTPPPVSLWQAAEEKLKAFGALDVRGRLTGCGKDMASMPIEPELANFILQNRNSYWSTKTVVDVAAMLSVGRFFVHDQFEEKEIEKVQAMFRNPDSDFMTLANIWQAYRRARYDAAWCRSHYLNPHWMRAVRTARASLLVWLRRHRIHRTKAKVPEAIDRVFLRGFQTRVLKYHHANRYVNMHVPEVVMLYPGSVLFASRPSHVVAYQLRRTTRLYSVCNHRIAPSIVCTEAPSALPERTVSPDPNPASLRLNGTLCVSTARGVRRVVRLDVNLERAPDTSLRLVDQGSVALDERRFPVGRLGLSDATLAQHVKNGIRLLAELPTTAEELRRIGRYTPEAVEETLAMLGHLGLVAPDIRTPQSTPHEETPRPFVQTVSAARVIQPAGATAIAGDDVSGTAVPDRLVRSLLEQPITVLDLSPSVCMYLWGVEITTVEDLTEKRESEVAESLGLKWSRTRGFKTSIYRAVGGDAELRTLQEVKARLAHFGLTFRMEETGAPRSVKKRYWRPDEENIGSAAVPELPPENPVSEEATAEKIGEQFPLFRALRESTGEAHVEARNQLWELNWRLARKFAKMYTAKIDRGRYRWCEAPLEGQDLCQEGAIGVGTALEAFDYLRGNRFSTYASWWIKQAIYRAIDEQLLPVRLPVHIGEKIRTFLRGMHREHDALCAEGVLNPTREQVAGKLGMSTDEFEELLWRSRFYFPAASLDKGVRDDKGVPQEEEGASTLADFVSDESVTPQELLEDEELRGFVRRLLSRSSTAPVDRRCVELYFGLDDRPHTLDEIGEQLGVTRERVRQRIARALDMLRTPETYRQAAEYVTWLAEPTAIRRHDTVIGETSDDRVRRVRRSNEDIADELLTRLCMSREVNAAVIRQGGELPRELASIRRHMIGEICGRAKLSRAFAASFFNLPDVLAVEKELTLLRAEEGKESIREGNAWRWDAMKVALSVADEFHLRPAGIFTATGVLGVSNPVLARARRTAIYRLREDLHLSFAEIAEFLNYRSIELVIDGYYRIAEEVLKEQNGETA